jgi:hypothetical protein
LPQSGGRPIKDHPPTLTPGSRAEVNGPIRGSRSNTIVLYKDDRPQQVPESREQAHHVGRMLSDGRLVKDVQYVFEPASQCDCQPHAL